MRQQINTPYVILVVDPGSHYRQTLAKRLHDHGHTVIQLPDGEEVIELYEYSGYPDMVILSDALPGMDGLETCTRLKHLANGSTTPVLILTDRFEDDDWVDQIYEAGADECLSRDVRPHLLCHRVNQLLKVRDMQMALSNEHRYQVLSDLAADFAYQMRVLSDGRVITEWASESTYNFTGYQAYHIGVDRWRGLIHPDDKPLAQERHDALLRGESRTDEFRLIKRDGSTRWVRDHAYPIWSPTEQRVIRIYGIGLDITTYKETAIALNRSEERLREQTLELQSRNDELEAFAQTVAHDLKNPISTMMGFASLVENYYKRMTDAQILEYINLIMESGYKAKEIIDALLLLAGVSQTPDVQIGPVDMAPLLKDVQRRLRPLIDETNAKIDIPTEWPLAQGYGPWLEEVWANYLSNALKYGGRPPIIQLGGETVNAQMVRFWVKDNGQGLSPEQQQKIFTPFTRLHNADIEGHGLGLSVVERIVHRLGGEVGLDSVIGQGSVFSFTLPTIKIV